MVSSTSHRRVLRPPAEYSTASSTSRRRVLLTLVKHNTASSTSQRRVLLTLVKHSTASSTSQRLVTQRCSCPFSPAKLCHTCIPRRCCFSADSHKSTALRPKPCSVRRNLPNLRHLRAVDAAAADQDKAMVKASHFKARVRGNTVDRIHSEAA